MSKVKVDLKTAIEFAQNGFEIECWVLSEPQPSPKRRIANRHAVVPKDAIVTLSLEGNAPTKGKSLEYWTKLEAKLWGSDPTKNVTRAQIDKELKRMGAYGSLFAHLLHQHKVIRVIS